MPRFRSILFTLVLIAALPVGAADWDPQAFGKEETLEYLTVGPEEGEHWSTVWLVVIEDQVYIRLGSRAAERMEKNTTAPYVKVRIAGQQFERVKAEALPDMVEPVAQAMSDKYWSDVFIKYFDHPLTMRLTPES